MMTCTTHHLACKCREEAISKLLESAYDLSRAYFRIDKYGEEEAGQTALDIAHAAMTEIRQATTGDGYFAKQVADNYGRPSKRLDDEGEAHPACIADRNVRNVAEALAQRSIKGLAKYGVSTERRDLNHLDWLQHLQEELMDACVYIEAAKHSIKRLDGE